MTLFEWTVIIIAMMGSAIIKNSVGVGSGIFTLPVLALVLPAKMALGLGAPAMLISDFVACRCYFKKWNIAEVRTMLPPAVIGTILGVFLVNVIPAAPFRKVVGGMSLAFAVWSFYSIYRRKTAGPRRPWLQHARTGAGLGFIGGAASSLAHAGGIVWSVYLMQKNLQNKEFVGTIALMFLVTNFLKVTSYVSINILDMEGLKIICVSVPFIILGGYIGTYVNNKIPVQLFRGVILVIIGLLGADLIIK